MIYGYARVSTVKQSKNGNSLDEQHDLLMAAGAEEIVTDSYTGTKMERPSFSCLLKRLQAGDKLIVTKLDRFARTAVEGGAIVNMIVERTQAGKAIAREKGIRVDGRPKKFTEEQLDHALKLLETGKPYAYVSEMTHISRSTLARAKKKNEKEQ